MDISSYVSNAHYDFEKNRSIVLKALKEAGVSTVTAEYSGYGDEGMIQRPDLGPDIDPELSVETYRYRRRPDGFDKSAGPLDEAVETLLYDILEIKHGGWEINEGSDGVLKWDVEGDVITISHSEKFIDSIDTETQV